MSGSRSQEPDIDVKVNVRLPKAEVERALERWVSEHLAPGNAPHPKPGSVSVAFVTNDNGFVCANVAYVPETQS